MEKLTPLPPQEAVNALIDHFLGRNWYIADPVSGPQGNAIAVDEIKRRFPKRKKFVIRRVFFDE